MGWKKRRSGLSTQWGPEAMLLSAGPAAQGGGCLIRTTGPREEEGGDGWFSWECGAAFRKWPSPPASQL